MSKIRLLSTEEIKLIAAGEVVESPASIVKELIENSFDAEASSVSLAIEEGGIKTISVSDNGKGIERRPHIRKSFTTVTKISMFCLASFSDLD